MSKSYTTLMEELFYKSALYEGKTEGAALEKYIVDQWNSPNKKIVINNPKIDAEAPTKIVNFLKKKGLSGTARKLATEDQLSSEWSSFFTKGVKASTRTPKTDIIIGSSRISLKMGAAQLMSGGAPEAKATFFAAYAQVKGLKESVETEVTKEFKELEESMTRLGNPENAGGETFKLQQNKDGTTPQLKDLKGKPGSGEINKSYAAVKAKKANAQQKMVAKMDTINNNVKKLLQNAFVANPKFGSAFVQEAITGEVKFGARSNSCAEYVLCSDITGTNSEYHKSKDPSFISHALSLSQPICRFKSTSSSKGTRNIWQVVAIVMGKYDETMEECYNFSDGKVLTEGVLDWLRKKWSQFKSFVSNTWNSAYEWITSSAENLFSFFNVEPQMQFKNEITWA